ncbi:MAG: alpha/beta fold hydrolase [Pseudomonadota bacterium]
MNDTPLERTHAVRDFRLASGMVLAEMVTACRTLGQLNANADNAVLVLHGYTTGPSMLDPGANVAEGSWSELVGPGKPIDSDRYFVICPNMLGSCYGSTGPGSINPVSGKPYGLDFPRMTMVDIVHAQKVLLDALGVRRLAAVAGPSFGGYQALQWALSYPEMVERVVAAVSAPFHPGGAGQSAGLLTMLSAAPGWAAWCSGARPEAMVEQLTNMRIDTLTRYGVDAELALRIPGEVQRAAELMRLARAWAQDFDPGSLIALMQTAETFDLRAQLASISAPVLLVLSRSDPVFSPALARQIASLPGTANWSYVELDSDKGHFASGADAALWAGSLDAFMRADSGSWTSFGFDISTAGEDV